MPEDNQAGMALHLRVAVAQDKGLRAILWPVSLVVEGTSVPHDLYSTGGLMSAHYANQITGKQKILWT